MAYLGWILAAWFFALYWFGHKKRFRLCNLAIVILLDETSRKKLNEMVQTWMGEVEGVNPSDLNLGLHRAMEQVSEVSSSDFFVTSMNKSWETYEEQQNKKQAS